MTINLKSKPKKMIREVIKFFGVTWPLYKKVLSKISGK